MEEETIRADVRARSAIDSAHEAFVGMDAGGFVIDWNAEAELTFGWTRQEALGKVLADLIIPERFRNEHWRGLRRYLETGDGPVLNKRLELAAIHREGHEFPVEITISVTSEGDAPAFHAFLHDISKRRRDDAFLKAQHAVTAAMVGARDVDSVLQDVLAAIGAAMEWQYAGYWEPAAAGDLRCVVRWFADGVDAPAFDEASRTTTFAAGRGLPGRVWKSAEPAWVPEVLDDDNFLRGPDAARDGLRTGVCVPVPRREGLRGVMEFFSTAVRRHEPEVVTMMATLCDQMAGFLEVLDERSHLVSKLERLATTDELTGVLNRRGWEEALARELARAAREGTPLWVALIDLDHFKAYNDEHGHQRGDELLRQVAQIWRGSLRATDALARYGGEEFALVFSTQPPETALTVMDRLRDAMPPGITCSAGLALWEGGEEGAALVGRADRALYDAKNAGRDRVVVAGDAG